MHIEPHGPIRGDLQAGIIAAQIANALRGADTEPVSAADFIPDFDAVVEAPKREAIRAQAEEARIKMHMLRQAAQRRKEG